MNKHKPKLKPKHKQIALKVHGKTIKVDQGVRELILQLNDLPNVKTNFSCQGNNGKDRGANMGVIFHRGYVAFGGLGAFPLLSQLTNGILREQSLWKKKHRHICRGCRGMTVTLEINGLNVVLRWQPWDYRRVLRMIAVLKKASA